MYRLHFLYEYTSTLYRTLRNEKLPNSAKLRRCKINRNRISENVPFSFSFIQLDTESFDDLCGTRFAHIFIYGMKMII